MIFLFDFKSDSPIYLQIRNQIVLAIASGKLKPGDKLPTVRALADESGINSMTVSKAYQILKSEGYIDTDRRNGAVVSYNFNDNKVSSEMMEDFKLKISELKLKGLKIEEIIDLCKKFYEEN